QAKGARALTLTRGRLPRATVFGYRSRGSGSPEFRVETSEPVGYVRFEEINGSTPQELRALARRLEDEGGRALILGLRQARQADLHATVLLADSLLAGGTVGRLRTADRVETYEADTEELFPGWPLAVLVQGPTAANEVAWLAAALQDNHRALVVGT